MVGYEAVAINIKLAIISCMRTELQYNVYYFITSADQCKP